MTARELVAVSKDREFLARVKYFATKGAIAILAENIDTVNHANRVLWAGQVLDGTEQMPMLALAVTTNATVAVNPMAAADSDIEFTVNSMINHFARG